MKIGLFWRRLVKTFAINSRLRHNTQAALEELLKARGDDIFYTTQRDSMDS